MSKLAMILGVLASAVALAADKATAPLPAAKAARTMLLPEGFHATVFAAEPDVVQPISFCIDARGRLWVAEALNYGAWQPTGKDRIVILEDKGDGRGISRKVFYEGFNYVTGIEVGFGGVWVMSPPKLYFIPDRDGDDKPDSEPQVLFDPDNVLYWRMPLVRLDAEALYDTLLLVAGCLDETRFGPGDRVQVRPDGLVTPAGTVRGWRRLIYVQQSRKQMPTHMENFDYPQMNPNCIERRDSTVATQALYLINDGMVHQLAEQFARRVRHEVGNNPAKQIERVYLIALSRFPSSEEKRIGLEGLAKLTDRWRSPGSRSTTQSESRR
jgi:hypothetical protein